MSINPIVSVDPKFFIDETGVYFTVLVFEDYVVKIPKKDKVKEIQALRFIADTQTHVAKHLDEVLPCWLIENVLVMPKAKGVRGDQVKDRTKVRMVKRAVIEQVKGLGYELRDVGAKNMFYDEDQDQMYVIDFHAVRKLPVVGGATATTK